LVIGRQYSPRRRGGAEMFVAKTLETPQSFAGVAQLKAPLLYPVRALVDVSAYLVLRIFVPDDRRYCWIQKETWRCDWAPLGTIK
jgi:hypothetical protein